MNQPSLTAAVLEFESGEYAACAALCASALEATPGDEHLLTLLAMSLHASGDFEGAFAAFAALARAKPHVAEYRANMGLMLRHLGRHDDAEAQFQQALLLPHAVEGTLVNYGLLLMDMGRVAEARHRFLDAVDAAPDLEEARIYAAQACLECGDTRRAEALLPPAHAWRAMDPALRPSLTKVLIHLGRIAEAETILEADLQGGHNPVAMAGLASLHERTNRLESARALLDRLQPHLERSDSDVRLDALALDAALALRAKDYQRANAATRALLSTSDLPAPARIGALFTSARIADKLGEQPVVMAELAEAHRLQYQLASGMAPEIAASAEEPLRIAAKWMQPAEATFTRHANDPGAGQSPVFIVGFPRSGTTMLEQMLDAHPGFVSMDERIIIQCCVERMESKGLAYPNELNRLDADDLAELRALYWLEADKVAARASGQTLVDKNPLNLLRVPMIRRLFPEARVILALRHPCDVILSCYMQNFRSPAFMVLCSTLERLAKSYVNAMRFWIHHQPLVCPDALVLRYEETVSDFGRQVEVIADYLGIADRAPLADFAAHAAGKKYISTPSYSQVIEPVNARAVARWEPYRSYFEPLFPILEPVARHWGYALDGRSACMP